jgi:shikimate kinase
MRNIAGAKERRRRVGAKLVLRMAGLLPQQGALCIAPLMRGTTIRIEKPIALVGMMGAGKSTVGRRLARRLDLPFVDSDAEIEAAAGFGIADMFARYGEAHFRDGERRVLARLVKGPRRVIATGGGAFVDEATRALILESCIAIWLDADPAVLAARVGRSDARPLLIGKDALATLEALAAVRNPIYAEAHLAIRSGRVPLETTVERIIAALAAR